MGPRFLLRTVQCALNFQVRSYQYIPNTNSNPEGKKSEDPCWAFGNGNIMTCLIILSLAGFEHRTFCKQGKQFYQLIYCHGKQIYGVPLAVKGSSLFSVCVEGLFYCPPLVVKGSLLSLLAGKGSLLCLISCEGFLIVLRLLWRFSLLCLISCEGILIKPH